MEEVEAAGGAGRGGEGEAAGGGGGGGGWWLGATASGDASVEDEGQCGGERRSEPLIADQTAHAKRYAREE